jgi:hypothetical protein
MRWATRAGVHIDRSACAWLIRRDVDPDAEFVFVTDPDDVPGVDLGHHGSDCTFETLLRRYDLVDPVLWRIAGIVHEADLEDERYDAPEAPGFDVILRALSLAYDDETVLAMTAPIFDAVYEFLRRAVLAPGGTPV